MRWPLSSVGLLLFLLLCSQNSLGQIFPVDEVINATFLNKINFYRVVFDSEETVGRRVQMLHFYLNWCSDSAAFAFEFRQFVRMASLRWSRLLDIGLLDCATNNQICVDFSNLHYPRIRMLPVHRVPGDTGQELDLLNDYPSYSTVNDIRVQFIQWFSKYGVKAPPKPELNPNWPHFVPLTPVPQSIDELLAMIHAEKGDTPVWIVVEDSLSILGRELMLDFSSKSDQVRIFRIVVEKGSRPSVALLGDKGNIPSNHSLPFFIAIDRRNQTSNVTIFRLDEITTISNYKAVSDFVEARYISTLNIRAGHLGRVSHGETAYSTQIFWTDLHNALHYILYHDVPREMSLPAHQITALVDFLDVTINYLSFPNVRVQKLLKQTRDWLEEQLKDNSSLPLHIESYLDALKRFDFMAHLEQQQFSYSVPFSACSNVVVNEDDREVYPRTDNIPERHFPCSLWTLFHSLTVGEYLAHPHHRPPINRTALVVARQYIVSFLGCRGCSAHFGNMSLNLRNELPHANSSVLWLWRAHNRVNARLKETASDVAVLAKRQFPTYQECFTCYRELPKESYFKNSTHYEPYYDEAAVLDFLVNFYHPKRMITDQRWPTPDQ